MSAPFTLRQLEYAVAVGRRLSFRAAAEDCHVSQPSLSTQVAQLETVLDRQLFERGPRGVIVTPFGEAFLARAREILERTALLQDLAQADRAPLTGEIRLGVIPTIAPFVLPPAIPLLRERHPDARLLLVEAQTESLVERVLDGQLDVLLLALEADLGPLETQVLFRDPFVAAFPRGHALSGTDAVGIDEIDRSELLLLEEGHCLSRQIADTCALDRDGEEHDFRATSLTTLVQMVAMGRGVTLLPDMARHSGLVAAADVALVDVRDDAYRTVGLAWRAASPRRAEFAVLGGLLEEAARTAET